MNTNLSQSGDSLQASLTKPDVVRTPEEVEAETKAILKEKGVAPTYELEVRDPLSGKTHMVSLDRQGSTEGKLLVALADPNLSRDRKDFAVSMYLYERGAQNTSMMVDLFRYKGQHTKETRVFKQQLRFDFEVFVNSFATYLKEQARLLGLALAVDIKEERTRYREWLSLPNNTGKGFTYVDFHGGDTTQDAMIEMAIHSLEEADTLLNNVRRMAEARERDKGKGIFVDKAGRPYTIDDPLFDEAIKADREATAEALKDEDI